MVRGFTLCILLLGLASSSVVALEIECAHPPKRINGAISVTSDQDGGHVNYTLYFPEWLDRHRLSMVQLFVGDRAKGSWVMTYLHPAKEPWLRNSRGRLIAEVGTLNSAVPLSVVAFYNLPPFCSAISELVIRR